MNKLSVIIPSKTLLNAQACVFAVKHAEPKARIILIDDGIDMHGELRQFLISSCEVIQGEKPFIFSRNMNAGIRAAGGDDVVLLNDDAILKTPGGFSLLQAVSYEREDVGLIASTTNAVGNGNQHNYGMGLRLDPRMVCFVAVFIPRRTIEKVGLLDERFTAYGFEDDDYCYRVRREDLKIGIHDGCFVDHASLKSTFRGGALSPAADLQSGQRIFEEKWGSYPL